MLKTLYAEYLRISLCIMFNRGVVHWLCSVEVVDDDIMFGPSCTHSCCWVRGATCHDAGTSRKSEIWRALWWRDPISHHSRSSQCVCPVTLQYGALWHSAWQAADSKPFGLVLLRPLFHKKTVLSGSTLWAVWGSVEKQIMFQTSDGGWLLRRHTDVPHTFCSLTLHEAKLQHTHTKKERG